MKKILIIISLLLLSATNVSAESIVKRIYEGNKDSKITILAYES